MTVLSNAQLAMIETAKDKYQKRVEARSAGDCWQFALDDVLRELVTALTAQPVDGGEGCRASWKDERCPITHRPYFMHIEHPDIGVVPTYGGPFDSYTTPEPDDDGNFHSEHYDHDRGDWIEGGEPEGLMLITEKEYNSLSLQQTPREAGWQPIATAPKYKEVLVYREDAGAMLGIYTSPDQFVGEYEWDKVAAEIGDSFEKEDWFLFCWNGVERVEGNEIPTLWQPLPPYSPPPSAGEGDSSARNQESVR